MARKLDNPPRRSTRCGYGYRGHDFVCMQKIYDGILFSDDECGMMAAGSVLMVPYTELGMDGDGGVAFTATRATGREAVSDGYGGRTNYKITRIGECGPDGEILGQAALAAYDEYMADCVRTWCSTPDYFAEVMLDYYRNAALESLGLDYADVGFDQGLDTVAEYVMASGDIFTVKCFAKTCNLLSDGLDRATETPAVMSAMRELIAEDAARVPEKLQSGQKRHMQSFCGNLDDRTVSDLFGSDEYIAHHRSVYTARGARQGRRPIPDYVGPQAVREAQEPDLSP